MKHLRRFFAIALSLCLTFPLCIPAIATTPELPSGIPYEELGTTIEEYVSQHEGTTAGMMVSVFHQDETLYANYFGYADKEVGIPVDQDTVMEWGSITKLLVWVSVMQLWEQDLIDLDADIRQYLPEGFLTNLEYDTPITMTHLMNHNAGFQEMYANVFIKEHDSIGTLESSLKAHMPAQIYEPGTVAAYSNWSTGLASYIVERICGESFDDYVHAHIFEPLGMEYSALSPDLSDNPWVQEKRTELQCYKTDGTLIPDCFYYIPLYPAGMCTSTLGDLETFAKALLDEHSPLFRDSDTWRTLFTPTAYLGDSDIPTNFHGFWMAPYGVQTVGHGGNTDGCSSFLLLDLESQTGAVVMTNQSDEIIYNYDMMELIFGEFREETYFNEERTLPEGFFRTARTIRVGPFKIVSLSYCTGDTFSDECWMTGTAGETQKICAPYGDYAAVPLWEFILEMALFFLWVAAVAFSVVSLLVKLIRFVVWKCKKKTAVIPLGGWSALAALSQLLTVALVGAIALLALGYALASSYTWMSFVIGILAIAMTALILYGIIKLPKTESSNKRKVYNWTTLILLAIALANILYWNLFMFWAI